MKRTMSPFTNHTRLCSVQWTRCTPFVVYILASILASSLALARNEAFADHPISQPTEVDPHEYHVRLRLQSDAAVQNSDAQSAPNNIELNYLQETPIPRNISNEEMRVTTPGEVHITIDMPKDKAALYQAKFNLVVTESTFDRSHFTRICFERKRPDLGAATDRFVKLRCQDRQYCELDDGDPGWAKDCAPILLEGRNRNLFEIIPAAYAATGESEQGWVSPSLETLESLPDQERVGYTRFEITSGPLPELSSANYFTFAIHVGKARTPVFIDGWPPAYLHQSFDSAEGLDFAFGLENLNFSGGEDGFEQIAVSLAFFNESNKVYDIVLVRDYAALRHAPKIRLPGEMGEIYEWSGRFMRAPLRDKYEIFITSSTKVEEVNRVRQLLDRSGLRLEGVPLRGAIRPPLGYNPNYGTTVGLLQPTGQIEFTFNKQRAKALCRYLLEERQEHPYIHRTTFVYEMGTGRKPECRSFAID